MNITKRPTTTRGLMTKITVSPAGLFWGSKFLGGQDDILCYHGEEEGIGGGVVPSSTPEQIDIILAAGDRVVGCEVKLPTDLVDSWFSRRLARQMRTLRAMCDVQVLVVRAGLDPDLITQLIREKNERQAVRRTRPPADFWEELTHWQTLGGYLLPVPRTGYLPYLYNLRRALVGGAVKAIAGTDLVERERRPGWLLRRIPSVGPKRSRQMIEEYGDSWGAFVAAKEGTLADKFSENIQSKIVEALKS